MQKDDPALTAASKNRTNEQPGAAEFVPLGSDQDNSVRIAEKRQLRYYLQTVARRLLNAEPDPERTVNAKGNLSKKGGVAKGTCGCLRRRVSKESGVTILHAPGTQSAHYGNLQICGNVWLCAVCGGKISERRRVEMTGALEASTLFKALVTFTLRHHLGDSCEEIKRALIDARKRLKGHRRFKAMMKRLRFVGHIYNFEPLHNLENGWHLHFHEILLFERGLTAEQQAELEDELKKLWSWALSRSGRDASWAHGVDLRVGDSYVQEYLAKYDRLPQKTGWTIEHELTKGATKKSALHGRTPYELLMLYGAGDKRAGALWMEFARAFKGVHQLQWSRGLKALLGVAEKSDQEIALEQLEPADELAELTFEEWKIVVGNDVRAELLNVAAAGDAAALWAWLAEIGIERSEPHVAQSVDYANDIPPPPAAQLPGFDAFEPPKKPFQYQ